MPSFSPTDLTVDGLTSTQLPGGRWVAVYEHPCTFDSSIFGEVMINLIKNPNINSNYLFRADILHDSVGKFEIVEDNDFSFDAIRYQYAVPGFRLERTIIRKMIPRNPQIDRPLVQCCYILRDDSPHRVTEEKSLVIYLPEVSEPSEMPWYHPTVRGVAFLHIWHHGSSSGSISIHYHPFSTPNIPFSLDNRLDRTALHLLSTLHKHGQGIMAGYQKRVHHDRIIPQDRVQNTYARLKLTHAKRLIDNWVEQTDPSKHVFEDLGIAAFLIELWRDIYSDSGREDIEDGTENVLAFQDFPGFVDIGCGNGVLVNILITEGFRGWGFDARRRKTWDTFSTDVQANLKEYVLVPGPLLDQDENARHNLSELFSDRAANGWHNGIFPRKTFIISNHADELTPWTPLLASLSDSPFIAIPCCSHDLSGAKFRALFTNRTDASPPGCKKQSTYSALVSWVERLAVDCGYQVEREMLRIPSTRNACLIGLNRSAPNSISVVDLLQREGGGNGWLERALSLRKGSARAH